MYLDALRASRRRFDRATRFEGWQAGPYRVTLDPVAYGNYARQIGLRQADRLVPSWFYVLAQRALLEALTDRRFPFPVTGMIHLSNRAQIVTRPDFTDDLTLTLDIAYGECTGAGHRVELEAHYCRGNVPVATNAMSALVRCPDHNRGRRSNVQEPGHWQQTAAIRFAANAGRRYARVSGDYNPIHLWPWSARMFGFARPIAHGMYSAARVAALLGERGLPIERLLDVSFVKPAFLPSVATLGYEHDAAVTRFELRSDDARLILHGAAQ